MTRIELLHHELHHMAFWPGSPPLHAREDRRAMVQEVFEIINSLNNKIIEATKAKNQAENKLSIINKELAKHTGRDGAVMMDKIARLVEINEVAEVKAWAKDQAIAKLHRKIDEAIKLLDQCSDKKTAGFVRSLLKE